MRAAHHTLRITEMKVFGGNVVYLAQQATCQVPMRLSYIKEQMSSHIMLRTDTVPLMGTRKSGVLKQACHAYKGKGQMVIPVSH